MGGFSSGKINYVETVQSTIEGFESVYHLNVCKDAVWDWNILQTGLEGIEGFGEIGSSDTNMSVQGRGKSGHETFGSEGLAEAFTRAFWCGG